MVCLHPDMAMNQHMLQIPTRWMSASSSKGVECMSSNSSPNSDLHTLHVLGPQGRLTPRMLGQLL